MGKILTQDFVVIDLPDLTGTEKQIAFGDKIRQKYIDIFNKKLNDYNIFDKKGRDEFTNKFRNFLNDPKTSTSKYWIDNHCAFCGCVLIKDVEQSKCSNEFCSYVKENRR